jgi:hypothetical protein
MLKRALPAAPKRYRVEESALLRFVLSQDSQEQPHLKSARLFNLIFVITSANSHAALWRHSPSINVRSRW